MRIASLVAALMALLWTQVALAAPPAPVEGVVVLVSDAEIVIDVGTDRGLPEGARVEVFRRLEVRHPVTGKAIVDRFPIGSLPLTEVGKLLSISTRVSSLERRPKVGDFVVFTPPAPRPAPTPAPKPDPVVSEAPGGPAASPALLALEETFSRTLGRPLTERIAIWEAYLGIWGDGPYTRKVEEELRWLRAELSRDREAPEVARPEPQDGEPAQLQTMLAAPHKATTEDAVEIHLAVVERELVAQARVLVRTRAAEGFEQVPMERVGDFNWRATLPEALTGVEGNLEFFTEIVRTNGTLEPAGNTSARRLNRVVIERPFHLVPPTARRSRLTSSFDFVNFKAGEGVDEFYRFESEFRYLVDTGILSNFLVGVGLFEGKGGPNPEAVAAGETSQRSISSGFAGVELALHEFVGVSMRVSAGNGIQPRAGGQKIEGAVTEGLFGFRMELRLGRADGAQIGVGAALVEEVGNEAWLRTEVEVVQDLLLQGSVVATNLPVGGELGVSINVGLGYRFTDSLALSLRTGFNARTINDVGPSVGAGVQLEW